MYRFKLFIEVELYRTGGNRERCPPGPPAVPGVPDSAPPPGGHTVRGPDQRAAAERAAPHQPRLQEACAGHQHRGDQPHHPGDQIRNRLLQGQGQGSPGQGGARPTQGKDVYCLF